MKEMEDTDLVSRSFLTVFFMDINNLKNSLTGYRSIILRLKIQTGQEAEKIFKNAELDDQMKNAVIQWCDDVRHNVERCQVAAEAIQQVIPDLGIENLRKSYEKIINNFAPDLKDVSEYTFEMNKTFVKATIEKIMNKMESFYDQFSKQ